jgi:hypothetical protein
VFHCVWDLPLDVSEAAAVRVGVKSVHLRF